MDAIIAMKQFLKDLLGSLGHGCTIPVLERPSMYAPQFGEGI